MHIGFFSYYEEYNNNRMFKDASASIGDDLLYPFVYLGISAATRGIRVSTIDTEPLESYDAIIFIDYPTLQNKYFRELIRQKFENLYLLSHESEIIRPDNCRKKYHKYFKKVFTYDDKFVDHKKYIKINYANKIPIDLEFDLSGKHKLCTLIAGNKFKFHRLELYSERIMAIRWFEQHHPEDFDLYGIGWDRHQFHGKLSRLNRIPFLNRLLKPTYPSYLGTVESKRETFKKYKFAICYENARDISGYISEKIFDCFFAGCVPVYWGAENVGDYIPSNAFIDRRNFKQYDKLYDYLKNMSNKEYMGYLCAIKDFVASDNIYPFSVECFAETVINEVVSGNC